MTNQNNYIRAIAGITLKNNILNNFNSIPPSVFSHVKMTSLKALEDPNQDATIRRTIGSVITAIIVRDQIMNWPEALKALVEKLHSSNPLSVEMALDTIQKICEDSAIELSEAIDVESNTPFLDSMIPRLIPFNSHPNPHFRALSISATNHFVQLRSPSFTSHIDNYLQSLFSIAFDSNIEVRQEVCRSFVMLLENYTDSLLPYLNQLIEYMIACNSLTTEGENTKVALEACDFWQLFIRLESIQGYLLPFLPQVVPVIFNSLAYTVEDITVFGELEDDPRHHSFLLELQPRFIRYHQRGLYNDHDIDDDDDDFDPEDEEFFSEWTLRKYSATSLDALVCAFKSHVTSILLPLLNQAFSSDDWKVVESGILALGAAAEGGIDEIAPELPKLIPFLVTNLSNSNTYIRYITCWTISQFSGWIVDQCNQSIEGRQQFYEPVLRELLKRILDSSRRVQEAACSAFSTLEEKASKQELAPYLTIILNHLSRALRLYKNRNLRLLYDTIGTLAESVGSCLNEPALIAVLMPPLISKWNKLNNTDSDLFPLLGCLTDIATSLGRGFLPFTEPVFTRCVMLIHATIQNSLNEDGYDGLDDEFIIVPLDLLSGIVQGLGGEIEPFLRRSPLLPLLAVCAHYNSRYEVLSPTYALIGDLAKACFTALGSILDNIMPELIRQIENNDTAFKSARNNAIWAVGEIAIRWDKKCMEKYIQPILKSLVSLINPPAQSMELHENSMNTIGRLGIHNPEAMMDFLFHFGFQWLFRSRNIPENDEKDSAFQGFCKIVRLYPHALNQMAIRVLFDIIGQWKRPSNELGMLFKEIIDGYHGVLTVEQWNIVSFGLNYQ
ncbi:MAG: armadillo-type protein [Benjaminiella poitrasii]|nr:MAG: armadillo-type protein [Benjaminiella poitrasii]